MLSLPFWRLNLQHSILLRHWMSHIEDDLQISVIEPPNVGLCWHLVHETLKQISLLLCLQLLMASPHPPGWVACIVNPAVVADIRLCFFLCHTCKRFAHFIPSLSFFCCFCHAYFSVILACVLHRHSLLICSINVCSHFWCFSLKDHVFIVTRCLNTSLLIDWLSINEHRNWCFERLWGPL